MRSGMDGAVREAGMWIVSRRPGHPAHVSAFPLLMTTFRVHVQGHRGNPMKMFSDDWFRAEWRKLGFHYDRDDEAKQWNIVDPKLDFARSPLSCVTTPLIRKMTGFPATAI